MRAYATNTAGSGYGNDVTFTTSPAAPSAVTDAATAIAAKSATLQGTVNAYNDSTTVTFDYGLTNAYGSNSAAVESPVTGNTDTSVSLGISSLAPNTQYHFRVNATNTSGTTHGADQTFTTLYLAPTLSTEPVTDILSSTATGNGSITDLGLPNPTAYGIVWGTALNPTVPSANSTDAGATSSTGAFTGAMTGLQPNTLYHVRAYASNLAGTGYGNDVTFTSAGAAPLASTSAATAVTSAGATMNGSVTANNDSTSVSFDYGLTGAYGTNVAASRPRPAA